MRFSVMLDDKLVNQFLVCDDLVFVFYSCYYSPLFFFVEIVLG